MSKEDEKVVVLRLRPGKFPLEMYRQPSPTCSHPNAVVDNLARRVTCAGCSVDLDPIEVLAKIAADATWVQHMRREKKELEQEIEKLKTERNNLRQGMKRISKGKNDGAS